MDERIQIWTRETAAGATIARVTVNDEFYAEVEGPDRDSVLSDANHYAMQIEFDEWGNW